MWPFTFDVQSPVGERLLCCNRGKHDSSSWWEDETRQCCFLDRAWLELLSPIVILLVHHQSIPLLDLAAWPQQMICLADFELCLVVCREVSAGRVGLSGP